MMDALNVKDYMEGVGKAARAASRATAKASTNAKNTALLAMAGAIRESRDALLAANAADLAEAKANGLDAAMVDRLTLTAKEIGRAHV
jgi:glutamate-5-semialdehyde dehydrogenase